MATAVFALRKFSLHEELGGKWFGIIGILLVRVPGTIIGLAIVALSKL